MFQKLHRPILFAVVLLGVFSLFSRKEERASAQIPPGVIINPQPLPL